MTYPYPYDQTIWNANDQRYWFNMVRKYRYPVIRVREPFRYLIEANKDAIWEEEYQQYLLEQQAVPQ
ncbi:hypothetical protein [Paenibacillus naphthalenovorans]|uniref:hypothetical protein n=1 Tax=Paenibacillus naphthalenovorans TaxID=162209 RepID=UPI00088E0026|nr:hypothetical protein [Paenibacillus naphthalenovorans]SDJ76037.1 hypothetical protein SAMN05421868_1435 [Paenibacillus naphthalenovorans]